MIYSYFLKKYSGKVVTRERFYICYRYNICEVVEFIDQWRCFGLDAQILEVRPYTG